MKIFVVGLMKSVKMTRTIVKTKAAQHKQRIKSRTVNSKTDKKSKKDLMMSLMMSTCHLKSNNNKEMLSKTKRKSIKMQNKKIKSLILTVNFNKMNNLIAVRMKTKSLEMRMKMKIKIRMSKMKMMMKKNLNNFHQQEITKIIGKIINKPKIKTQSQFNKTINLNPPNPDKILKRKENLTSLNDLFLLFFTHNQS